MEKRIELLDCTLRDGAYITDSHFGTAAIKGIIKKMQDANADIIECGWLKDKAHEEGTTYFHVPADLEPYLLNRKADTTYVVMIDWDRYDTDNLPPCDGNSIDAVRVVFPHGKHREGIAVGQKIRDKGYKVFFQAANTLAYRDTDLDDLVDCVNEFRPVSLSVVDTFGAMFFDDLEHIVKRLDARLDPAVKVGFHSHNNQQLSFALTMDFIKLLEDGPRGVVVDASLCGMGRGAGNATTELVVSYLNRKQHGNYDMDAVMDAIDMYIQGFQEKYDWGYSTPYFIAGMYQCHVNNIAYLLKNHRTNARDMRNVIAALSTEERRHYDYDLLEEKYMENQDRLVDDEAVRNELKKQFVGRKVMLLAPGRSVVDRMAEIKTFIAREKPVVIGVNALIPGYGYDKVFFTNSVRYAYAQEAHKELFDAPEKILLSNIKTEGGSKEVIINFNLAIKRGWVHFDNAVICALRMLDKIGVNDVALAGFDGFKTHYNESYADASLPTLNPSGKWEDLNREIRGIYADFRLATKDTMKIQFVTDSIFDIGI